VQQQVQCLVPVILLALLDKITLERAAYHLTCPNYTQSFDICGSSNRARTEASGVSRASNKLPSQYWGDHHGDGMNMVA